MALERAFCFFLFFLFECSLMYQFRELEQGSNFHAKEKVEGKRRERGGVGLKGLLFRLCHAWG